MLRRYVACLLLLSAVFFSGCTRYNYTVHESQKHKKSGNSASSASIYMVKKGDTLYRIGQRFGVDFKTLARKNNIPKPYTIFMGQRIYLKGKAPSAKALPVPKKTKATHKPQQIKHKKPILHAKARPKHTAKKVNHPAASRSHVKLHWPVKGRLSSHFGPRNNRMHDGIDIAANEGVAVKAAAAGEVVYADARLTGYGNLIIIRHSTDLFTAYAHNKVNLVKRGDKVVTGQRIAYVGSTGRSSGPHLHFEVRRGETAVDPLAYLPKK